MELGLDFDDSDFVKEEKPKQLLTSYNAKICSPEWFLQTDCEDGHIDKATLDKFRGDLYYKKTDYEKAIDCYNTSLGNLGSQNRTMRREVTESLSRCNLNIGNVERALKLSDKVMDDCLTRDQSCQGLMLKQHIHQMSGQIRDELHILYQLIHLHPRNVKFWTSLKHVYDRVQSDLCTPALTVDTEGFNVPSLCSQDIPAANKLETTNLTPIDLHVHADPQDNIDRNFKQLNITGDAVTVDHVINGSPNKLHSECVAMTNTSNNEPHANSCVYSDILTGFSCRLLKLTCCERIRIILQTVHDSVGSFLKDRNQQLKNKIDEEIHSLGVEEKVLQRVTEFMKNDMFEDDYENKADAEEEVKEIPTFTSEEFNKRWFSWINDT